MRPFALAVLVGLIGCGAPGRTVEDFIDDPEAAARIVDECRDGRVKRECEAAERGLIEARRRARIQLYERTSQSARP